MYKRQAKDGVRIAHGALEIENGDAEGRAFENRGKVRKTAHLAYVLPRRRSLLLRGLELGVTDGLRSRDLRLHRPAL